MTPDAAPSRVCIFGAGAVGGFLAAKLALAGHDVCVIARGEHLTAMAERGLTLISGDGEQTVAVTAAPTAAGLGPQDLVIVTLKATGLGGLDAALAPLLNDDTPVVFAQNGAPWWYGYGLASDAPPPPDLGWMDPDGGLARLRGRALGAVVRSANEVTAPGVVRNNSPIRNALIVGELDDSSTPRVEQVRALLEGAGVSSPPPDAIRRAVWRKLVVNMTGSVLSLLLERPSRQAQADPAFAVVRARLLAEARAVAEAHVGPLEDPPARSGSEHVPSMLQDFRLGRPLEIDALVRAPLAFARAAGIETPSLDLMGLLATFKAAGPEG